VIKGNDLVLCELQAGQARSDEDDDAVLKKMHTNNTSRRSRNRFDGQVLDR
jgi:hypothetical protein